MKDTYIRQVLDASDKIQDFDVNSRGLISVFDSDNNVMYINGDYYSWSSENRIYKNEREISDLFSLLQWNIYHNISGVKSIVVYRPFYTMLFAQLGKAIPPLGILHIEHFYGVIPCIKSSCEPCMNINDYALLIVERLKYALGNKNYCEIPAVLLENFWAIILADSPEIAIEKARVLELVAKSAWMILQYKGGSTKYIDYAVMNMFYSLYNGDTTGCYMQLIPEEGEKIE